MSSLPCMLATGLALISLEVGAQGAGSRLLSMRSESASELDAGPSVGLTTRGLAPPQISDDGPLGPARLDLLTAGLRSRGRARRKEAITLLVAGGLLLAASITVAALPDSIFNKAGDGFLSERIPAGKILLTGFLLSASVPLTGYGGWQLYRGIRDLQDAGLTDGVR